MSSGADKTEKPTPRRLQKAREDGQVAKSMDLNGAVVMGTAIALIAYVGNYGIETVTGIGVHLWTHLKSKPMTMDDFLTLWQEGILTCILIMAPFALTVMLMGIGINLLQVKPLFTTKPLHPKWDKLNPFSGVKRLWSMRSVIETLKALLKMVVIGWVAYGIIMGRMPELLGMAQMELTTAIQLILDIVGQIALMTVILFLVMGAADWRYQIYELEKALRMTKQEIRDERKDVEGDPHVKAKIRQAGQQMVRKRQLAAVPSADVIITNPTHFAIAIKYDPDIYPAPHVVAKGVDHFALKIREVAKDNNVPIVENKPLARSLYAMVDVDQMIPPDFFVAVAEVLAFVFSKNKGRRKKVQTKRANGNTGGLN